MIGDLLKVQPTHGAAAYDMKGKYIGHVAHNEIMLKLGIIHHARLQSVIYIIVLCSKGVVSIDHRDVVAVQTPEDLR